MAHIIRGEVPENATRVHWGRLENALRPRGSYMAKEGLGLDIYDDLYDNFESWTDARYGDSQDPTVVRDALIVQAREACEAAIKAFLDKTS